MFYREVIRNVSTFKINIVVKVLTISDLLVCSAANLVAPIFAIFIVDKLSDGGLEAVGISTMIYLVVNSLLEIPIAIYIDRTKSEKDDYYLMILGTVLGALPFMVFPVISHVWQLYLLEAVAGAASALAYPGWSSLFTRHIDKAKAAYEWSIYDVLIGIGMALTAAIGGYVAEKLGFGVLFASVGVLTIVGSIVLFAIHDRIRDVR